MRLTKVHHGRLNQQNRNKMGENCQRKLAANHQQISNWIKQIIGLLVSRFFFFFFLYLFLCSFVLFRYKQLLALEKRLADFNDRQQILLKTPTVQLNKVHHGKHNRHNRNKMGEDRQWKLAANHQQFSNWIKQLIGLEWNSF